MTTTKRLYGAKTKRRTYTVTDEINDKLRAFGGGNASRGIREAVKLAEEKEQTKEKYIPVTESEKKAINGFLKAFEQSHGFSIDSVRIDRRETVLGVAVRQKVAGRF